MRFVPFCLVRILRCSTIAAMAYCSGLANPVGTILSSAMMLRESLGMAAEADLVEAACSEALQNGFRTKDIQGSVSKSCSTSDMGDAIINILKAKLA